MVDSVGQVGAEIEITPAMIEAGALAVCDYDPESETASSAALRVYRSMIAATAVGSTHPTSTRDF